MGDWWNSVSGFERIFWYIAIPFTVAFVFKSVLSFIGFGEEDGEDGGELEFDDGGGDEFDFEDIETEVDGEDGDFEEDSSGLHLLTIRNFIIFFAVFGWAGISGVHFGFGKVITLLFTTSFAFITILIVASIFYNVTKLAESGTLKLKNAINRTGDVYIQIPPNQSGIGKVNISFGSSVRELDAITDGELIPTGSKVVVLDIIDGDTLLVDKLDE